MKKEEEEKLYQLRKKMNNPEVPFIDRKSAAVALSNLLVKFCYYCGKETFSARTILVRDGEHPEEKHPVCYECNRRLL